MTKSTSPAADLDKVIVRLPDGMRDELKEKAKNNDRSVNAEIVQRLKQSLAEGSADLVKLDLPDDLWNMLMTDASMNNMSMDERVIEILHYVYESKDEYTQSIDKTLRLASENSDLHEKIDEMKIDQERLEQAIEKYKQIDKFFQRIEGLEKVIDGLREDLKSSNELNKSLQGSLFTKSGDK